MLDILDVTLRDGLYVANYLKDQNKAYSIVDKLLETGIEFIEVGYWDDEAKVSGPASCDIEYLRKLPMTTKTYCMMIQSKNISRVDFRRLASTPVSMLRFPCTKLTIGGLQEYIYEAKKLGFRVSVNLIRATEHNLSDLVNMAKLANSWDADWVYIADSNGAFMPEEVYRIIYEIQTKVSSPVGFHAHNGRSFALANALQAISAGASLIDTSLCGIGKGGNLPLELLSSFLYIQGSLRLNLMPIFEAILEEIYPEEGDYILAKTEDMCTAILNYNLDHISELKAVSNERQDSFLLTLARDIQEKGEFYYSIKTRGEENERFYQTA